MLSKEAKYYRCEYENLRRKKNKQIERMKINQIKFFDKTWKFLHLLGMKDMDIIEYYKYEEEKNDK